MAYQRVIKTGFPVRKDADDDYLVWLTRESFQDTAASDGLVLAEFTDLGVLDPSEVSPAAERAAADAWGVPPAEISWRVFEGLAVRPALPPQEN